MTDSRPPDVDSGGLAPSEDERTHQPDESRLWEPGRTADEAEDDRPDQAAGDAPRPDTAEDDELEDDEPDRARTRAAALEELRRYEAERQEKRRRRDASSRKVVGWIVAVALALLLYDSAGALRRAVSAGDPWGRHAVMAAVAVLGLVGLLAAGLRAMRRR